MRAGLEMGMGTHVRATSFYPSILAPYLPTSYPHFVVGICLLGIGLLLTVTASLVMGVMEGALMLVYVLAAIGILSTVR